MALSQRLAEYISACFTGLWIESHEHDDALAEIAQMCREQNWRLATWDIEQGLQIPVRTDAQPIDAGGSDPSDQCTAGLNREQAVQTSRTGHLTTWLTRDG
ncbi:MAG: hypothetical protein ABR915_19660 [Thermoguttaceae bacterium]